MGELTVQRRASQNGSWWAGGGSSRAALGRTCAEMAAVSVPPERGTRGAAGAGQETEAGCVDRFDSSVSFGEQNEPILT